MQVNGKKPEVGGSLLVSEKGMQVAVDAIAAMIAECLASDDPIKFATVVRLAKVGQDLRKAVAMGAADHMKGIRGRNQGYIMQARGHDDEEEGGYGQVGVYNVDDHLIPRTPGDLARNPQLLDSMMGSIMKALQPSQSAQDSEREAREIGLIQKAMGAASDQAKPIMQTRLDALIRKMDERNKIDAERTKPCVVLPDLQRGHQVGAQGNEGDAGAVRDTDPGGGQGVAGATGQGRDLEVGRGQGLRA
jgi:hypothetical protein